MKNRFHVRNASVNVLLFSIFIFALFNVLAFFNIMVMPLITMNLFTIFAGIFLLTEQAFMGKIKSKKGRAGINPFEWIIIITALLGIISAVFNMAGIVVGFFGTMQGYVNLAILIFVVVELFRRN